MIQLSPSKLNVLKECPRCFWNANVKGIDRPRGAFPSLPGGIDIVMKKHFDQARGKGLPLAIQGFVQGELFQDQSKIRMWRNWRTGLTFSDTIMGVRLIGALDDLVIEGGKYSPLDYKTKGSEPKTDGAEYYQIQLDCYALMLENNGYKTTGKAYLVYFYPEIVKDHDAPGGIVIDFKAKPFTLSVDSDRARGILQQAVDIFKKTSPPEANPDCEYCRYATSY